MKTIKLAGQPGRRGVLLLAPDRCPEKRGAKVYFALNSDTGNVKIGATVGNPRRRIADLQVGCDGDLQLAGWVWAWEHSEKSLHRKFAAHRIHGEWFSGQILPVLQELAASRPIVEHPEVARVRKAIAARKEEAAAEARRERLRQGRTSRRAEVPVDAETLARRELAWKVRNLGQPDACSNPWYLELLRGPLRSGGSLA